MNTKNETSSRAPANLQIGAFIFPKLDQMDFTGPFAVFARVPGATVHILAQSLEPLRDAAGLVLTPTKLLTEAPSLDLFYIPGGGGVNEVLKNPRLLKELRDLVERTPWVMSVCTGALILGATGLLKNRRATTHWASHHLLQSYGAIPVHDRVVVDDHLITTAGVTAGLKGALKAVDLVVGRGAAQSAQVALEYAPEPLPWMDSSKIVSDEVLAQVRQQMRPVIAEREALARDYARCQ
jgi:cyclohexyl-isocyanide hydratase